MPVWRIGGKFYQGFRRADAWGRSDISIITRKGGQIRYFNYRGTNRTKETAINIG